MDRSNVPKFGNWENDGDVPYTAYFDKARKKRGGKMINPNENLDIFPKNYPSSLPRIGPGPEHQKTKNELVRAQRHSEGSGQSLERSLMHPYYQAKVLGHDSSHGTTPGRSRLKPTKADQSPDGAAAVPRFGEWDENDPKAAEDFTHIFNQVREERNAEAGNVSVTPKNPSYGRQQTKKPKKSWCFCW